MRKRQGFTLIEIMIVVLIIGILLGIAVPNFVRARENARTKACIHLLRDIQAAKEQWAMDNNKPPTAMPVDSDLFGTDRYIIYLQVKPACPEGGTYTLGSVDTAPTCSIGGEHKAD